MITIPPYLKPGDTIGIVCPAGYMDFEKMQNCIAALGMWGYNVRLGNTTRSSSSNYFSGSDEERLSDLQQMLDDNDVHAILCGRGGYGLTRIVDKINFKKFKANPKWVIGFSDVTVLLNHIYTNCGIAALHAPMAGAFNDPEPGNKYLLSLHKALEGKKIQYAADVHPFNRKGEVVGELVGGNLALLSHCVGTDSDIKTRGKILFIEDVGEYLYNIDRMMHQLKRAGKLKKLGGLIVGHFSDNKDTDRPFGQEAEEIIRDVVSEYDFPVCFGFPVGHEKENLALKVGVGYKLKVTKNRVVLEE
ncbi:MAG: LD-carboxypeptidase [Chitinophagaceae bacterium]|nr:LD-carboxypeptidase [Chitinophagaceae bacterium]